MRKIISLALTLALLLALAACGGEGKGEEISSGGPEVVSGPEISQTEQETSSEASSSQGLQEPEREPIGNPAVISYPELLPEEVTISPLYQQALERSSVISYKQGIATAPQPVYDFLAAAERGEDRDLYCYDFYTVFAEGLPSLRLTHFISDGGALSLRIDYADDWEKIAETSDCYRITDLTLSDYGRLIYHRTGERTDGGEGDGWEYDTSVLVVNDYDLYDNADQRRQMKETYLDPIQYCGIGVNTWASPREINNLIFAVEDLYRHENQDTPFDHFGSSWPMDFILETLSRCFEDVTAQDVIANVERFLSVSHYDPQTDTVYYEGGRGGAFPTPRVTNWTQKEDLLLIDYDCDNIDTGIKDYSRRLTVRLMEDGTFRYLSNLEP